MKKNNLKKACAITVALALVLSCIPNNMASAKKAKTKLSKKEITITVGKTKTLKLKNNVKNTKWTILSGKKNITLKKKKKNSVKVLAKKKGKAKVQVRKSSPVKL